LFGQVRVYGFKSSICLSLKIILTITKIMKILVNIPAFNEEKLIWQTIKDIQTKLHGYEYSIQVVDDGSSDNTISVAKNAWADMVISHEFNKWVWWAFKTAVTNFLSLDYDIMVNIDADGQFDPSDIINLLQPIVDFESDIVIASRFSWTQAQDIPFIKDKLNRLIAWTVWSLMWKKIDDLTCWFRAYSRESLLRLNLIETFTYTQETIIDAFGKNLRIKWIPVHVKYFAERQSRVVKSIFWYMWKSMMIILRTVRDVRPLVFFWYPWLFLIFIAFILFIIFLINYLQTFQTSPYRTWLIISGTSFLIWLLLFVFASVADMIKRHRKISEENLYLLRKIIYDGKGK
jgi:glycosyltransferase involved in cell wall biosynthesis